MIWGKTREQRKIDDTRREHWHWWFAWHPVELETGRTAWLMKLKRKGKWCDGWAGCGWAYRYKESGA